MPKQDDYFRFKIPGRLRQRVIRYAAELGVSKSQFIRAALIHFMSRQPYEMSADKMESLRKAHPGYNPHKRQQAPADGGPRS